MLKCLNTVLLILVFFQLQKYLSYVEDIHEILSRVEDIREILSHVEGKDVPSHEEVNNEEEYTTTHKLQSSTQDMFPAQVMYCDALNKSFLSYLEDMHKCMFVDEFDEYFKNTFDLAHDSTNGIHYNYIRSDGSPNICNSRFCAGGYSELRYLEKSPNSYVEVDICDYTKFCRIFKHRGEPLKKGWYIDGDIVYQPEDRSLRQQIRRIFHDNKDKQDNYLKCPEDKLGNQVKRFLQDNKNNSDTFLTYHSNQTINTHQVKQFLQNNINNSHNYFPCFGNDTIYERSTKNIILGNYNKPDTVIFSNFREKLENIYIPKTITRIIFSHGALIDMNFIPKHTKHLYLGDHQPLNGPLPPYLETFGIKSHSPDCDINFIQSDYSHLITPSIIHENGYGRCYVNLYIPNTLKRIVIVGDNDIGISRNKIGRNKHTFIGAYFSRKIMCDEMYGLFLCEIIYERR